MTKDEEAFVGMVGRNVAFLTLNKDKFSGSSRLSSEINTLSGYQVLLAPMLSKQSEVTTGITANKKVALANLCVNVVEISARALVYANDINDMALAAIFTVTTSSFKYQSQTKQLQQAKGIADMLTANATALIGYDVSSTDIATIVNGISTCESQVVAPGTAKDSKKTATSAIKKALVGMADSYVIIDSLMSSLFARIDAELFDGYRNSRRIDARGVRHTGITVTFTDAATGNVIEGATTSIALLNKTAVSNINGVATIPKMKTGTYHIDFSANGYATQVQDVIVPRSRKVDIAMAMVAAV